MDTIFARATVPGRSGVAVIRISGPKAKASLLLLTKDVSPRKAELRKLQHKNTELDEALVMWFPGPNSFTGEDVIELQLHGSIAVVNAVLSTLGKFDGLRPAEPGEFTRRALENNKLDLGQIEGLADLIDAETETQRQQAQRIFSGALTEQTNAWRTQLIRAAALLEATIDFVDEEVPVDVYPEVSELLSSVSRSMSEHIAGFAVAERIREGFEVAIIGSPNIGKSTLLNHLAGRDAAITSEIAGTTRDVIEVKMDLNGLPVTLLDTAGIRDTEDQIEALGVQRAMSRADAADLRVVLLGPDEAPMIDLKADDIALIAKSDLQPGDISGRTGAGVEKLVSHISTVLADRVGSAGIATRERHRVAMTSADQSLLSAMNRLEHAPDLPELIAEDLRDAVRKLDVLVGRVDVEDLLDEIFSSFCIGK